jgi:hypothetical protein
VHICLEGDVSRDVAGHCGDVVHTSQIHLAFLFFYQERLLAFVRLAIERRSLLLPQYSQNGVESVSSAAGQD